MADIDGFPARIADCRRLLARCGGDELARNVYRAMLDEFTDKLVAIRPIKKRPIGLAQPSAKPLQNEDTTEDAAAFIGRVFGDTEFPSDLADRSFLPLRPHR